MIDSAESRPGARFTAENEDLLEYRELSRLAIAGLVLGLFSIGAIFTPVLWIVPVVAIALNLVAYYQIVRSEVLTGRLLSLIGLSLAGLWLGLAVTQSVTQNRLLMSSSREMAQGWLEVLLDKQIMPAHQLTLHPDSRQAPSASLETHYASDEMNQEELDLFRNQEAVAAIRNWEGGPLEAKFVRDLSSSAYEGVDYTRHAFQIVEKETGQPVIEVEVGMKRYPGREESPSQYGWSANGIELTKKHAQVDTTHDHDHPH